MSPQMIHNRAARRKSRQALRGTEIALAQPGTTAEGHAMTICGVITTRDVLRHSSTIVREFGAAAYLRCCVAILFRRRTTFLNCVCELTRDD
jgi:hypothetical protein